MRNLSDLQRRILPVFGNRLSAGSYATATMSRVLDQLGLQRRASRDKKSNIDYSAITQALDDFVRRGILVEGKNQGGYRVYVVPSNATEAIRHVLREDKEGTRL